MKSRAFLPLALLVLLAAPAARAGEPEPDAPRWLRVAKEEGKSLALEIAVREFGPREGDGPVVALVGVVHVGEESYYRALAEHLAGYDLVLYESVKPEGAVAPGGETEEERVRTTRAALRFLASLAGAHRAETGAPPAGVEALREWVHERDVRLADFLELCLSDAWRRAVTYSVERAGDDLGFRFRSLGADAAPGGEGPAADIVVGSGDDVAPFSRPEGDNLQVRLARLLRLSFQLDAIDYGSPRFRSSDMSIDEVRAAIARRGGNPEELTGSLTGSSLSAGLAKILIGVLRFGDILTGGLVSDTMKAVMIEVLADETLTATDEGPFGTPTMKAIIEDRNVYVMGDLARVISDGDAPARIAVFYGAGHMRDFEDRFAADLDYVPLETPPLWFPAIRLDLETSKVNERLLEELRKSIRAQLDRMRR